MRRHVIAFQVEQAGWSGCVKYLLHDWRFVAHRIFRNNHYFFGAILQVETLARIPPCVNNIFDLRDARDTGVWEPLGGGTFFFKSTLLLVVQLSRALGTSCPIVLIMLRPVHY